MHLVLSHCQLPAPASQAPWRMADNKPRGIGGKAKTDDRPLQAASTVEPRPAFSSTSAADYSPRGLYPGVLLPRLHGFVPVASRCGTRRVAKSGQSPGGRRAHTHAHTPTHALPHSRSQSVTGSLASAAAASASAAGITPARAQPEMCTVNRTRQCLYFYRNEQHPTVFSALGGPCRHAAGLALGIMCYT